MRSGYTREPCQGCGTTEEHRKKMLCGACQTKMRAGEQFITQQHADESKCPYHMDEQAPYIPYGGNDYHDAELARAARRHFTTLIEALGTMPAAFVPGTMTGDYLFPPDDRIKHYEPIWRRVILLPPDIAATIHEFYVALYLLIRHSYAQGKYDGAHLLAQLAAGEITVAQLNETTISGS